MQYAVFDRPAVTIYDLPQPTMPGQDGQTVSAIGDQGLYGQSCQVLEDAGEMGIRAMRPGTACAF